MPGVYLGEPYTEDRPGTQVFLAPGAEDQNVVDGISPYVFGRMVRIPARHWHRLLLAIGARDFVAAELLDRWSGSADPDDDGMALPRDAEIARVRHAWSAALADLGHTVAAEREGADTVTAWDYERMVTAVDAVLQAAYDSGEPLTAWFE